MNGTKLIHFEHQLCARHEMPRAPTIAVQEAAILVVLHFTRGALHSRKQYTHQPASRKGWSPAVNRVAVGSFSPEDRSP